MKNIDGKWWINGIEAPPQMGTLEMTDEKLELTIKSAETFSVEKVLERMTSGYSWECPKVIMGRDEHNKPVTLFGCACFNESTLGGFQVTQVEAIAAIQGLQLNSRNEKVIRAVSLQFDVLHEWLGGKVLVNGKLPDGTPYFTMPQVPELIYEVCDGVQLRIDRKILPSSGAREYHFKRGHRIWLHFDELQSLADVTEKWNLVVMRFLSLLVGAPAVISEVEVFTINPFEKQDTPSFPAKFYRAGGDRRNRIPNVRVSNMLAPFSDIEKQMPEIVRNWFEIAKRFEPVVHLFSTVAFHNRFHAEASFLFLMQALEVYHARAGFASTQLPQPEHDARVKTVVDQSPVELKEWARAKLQANEKTLDMRLSDIFTKHAAEAGRLFGDVSKLSERLRYTRNHLTHDTNNPESPRILGEHDLEETVWKLEVFVWICLLKETGVQGRPIERLLRRGTEVRLVLLDEKKGNAPEVSGA